MSKKEQREVVINNANPASPTVTVKTKRRGGCGTFILGFVFAFVLMIVVVVGTGLYMYYNMSIRMVENMIGVTIPVEGDIKNLAIKDLLAKKDQIVNASLETLNTEFKVDLPETIPGTKISLKETYDETITFLGETKKVKEFRVQDIANNLSDFVDAVLPKLYDHVTVGQICETAGTTILDDLGYPATKDTFYNVGTESAPVYKTLSELTITQALDVVPDYFSSDTLTVQMALDALGSDLMPKPTDDSPDIYAGLRDLVITDITNDTIKNKITGAILLDLVDLSGYDFLQTETFKATTLNDFGDYFKTLTLGEFVELSTVVSGDETAVNNYFAKPQYKNLAKDLKLSEVRETILNLKLNQIFSATDLAKIQTVYTDTKVTVEEFFTTYGIADGVTFETATTSATSGSAIDWASYDGYVNLIKDVTAGNYKPKLDGESLQDLLGGSDLVGPIAKIAELTIQEIIESDSALDTLLNEFGTLGELVGNGNTDGIFGIIGGVEISALLDDPATALNNALKDDTNTKTLRELLNVSKPAGENAIITAVMDNVTVSQLFNDGSSAITNAISGLTLGDMMELGDDTTGFIKYLKNVKIGVLMGNDATTTPENAIKDALTLDGTNKITLGEFLGITSSDTGILAKMKGIYMQDLLGNSNESNPDPAGAIQKVVDELTIQDVFGDYETQTSDILKELYDLTITDATTKAGQGTMKVTDVFDRINDVHLKTVLGQDTATGIYTLIVIKNADGTVTKGYDDITIGDMANVSVKSNLTIGDLITAGVLQDNGYSDEFKTKSIQAIVDTAAAASSGS